jgi:hypothetical protein
MEQAIDTFRDMGDREVSVEVDLAQIKVHGPGVIRLNAADDVDRLIAALQKAKLAVRGGR